MTETTQLFHQKLFGISPTQRLSAMDRAQPVRAPSLVPCVGGLALGLRDAWHRRASTPRRSVDPIEANALFGGRMSLTGSLIVVLQTIMSNGVGASIGLEAGYTQIGSAIASQLGHAFRVRRNDLRLLVGCGAAAAIAGAFNAPLTGAFYAFELVIGTYSLGTFAPVAVAALVVAVPWCTRWAASIFELTLQVPGRDRPARLHPDPGAGHAVRAARHRHHARRHADRGAVPPQPACRSGCGRRSAAWRSGMLALVHAGGAVVRPRRAGHGDRGADYTLTHVAAAGGAEGDGLGDLDRLGVPRRAVLRLAVSRRGAGQGVRRRRWRWSAPRTPISPAVCALVGMSGLAVAIIGGPLTMGFLALESDRQPADDRRGAGGLRGLRR